MNRRTARILVVDDEPTILQLLVEVPAEEDYATPAVPIGTAALEMIGRETPDLVLMDFMMPGPDGREVARRMRQRPEWNGVPVILMSAAASVDPVEEGVAFLPKPFDLDDRLRPIETATGGRPPAGQDASATSVGPPTVRSRGGRHDRIRGRV